MSLLKTAFIKLIRPDYEDLRNASAIRVMRDYAKTRIMYREYMYIYAHGINQYNWPILIMKFRC